MTNQHLSEQEIIRREKLQEFSKLGIDPYPAELYPVNTTSTYIKSNYKGEENKDKFTDVCLAGRILSIRDMGKASFAVLQDGEGKIQIYVRKDDVSNGEDKSMYDIVWKKLLDIGDIIGVKGYVFTTKTGETSIHVSSFTVLAKALRPLPIVKEKDGETFDEVTDAEFRYRQRYADLIVNPHVKEVFMFLKRLIVGGFEWVYEFSRNFRNEGMDRTHNPEFTILEFYVSYKDYIWMMETTEHLLEHTAMAVNGTTKVHSEGKEIDMKGPYKKITMYDAIKENTGIDISEKDEDGLREVCQQLGIHVDKTMGKGKLIDEIFSENCEKNYIQPTFITDYPVEMSPLTKKHRSKPGLVERFELIINGKEIANAYSELNDPIEQRNRFEEQAKLMERGDDEAMFIDHDFLRALEYGMPPNSGIGIGIDRLVMLLTNQQSIQDVLFFPQMRPEKQFDGYAEEADSAGEEK